MLRKFLSLALTAAVSFSAVSAPVFAGVSAVGEIKSTPQDHPGLILDQFYLGCLSHASYLIGDPVSKTAVIVDPQRDISQYLDEAAKQGLKITHVFLTHVHADFVAGHLELQRKVGAKICIGAKTKASFSFTKLKEGDVVDLGNVQIKVLETPGHTPEAISLLVYNSKVNKEKPYAVLTGDCLFIGDVGRPDLLASKG
ncbi:MAG TPA: MBL fold metallo-hydrolase, partial [Candidatus Melainabacteria bacterium]|nr:MBL fold metallo-hydrolase [Candidatus Melainabacteria bacterium]